MDGWVFFKLRRFENTSVATLRMKRLLLLCLLLSVTSLSAWSPAGHMVIGEIAKERRSGNAECGVRNAE